MGKISQARIIGIDVSRDWLDIHCLPDGKRLRMANKLEGHDQGAQLALELGALVCFETTGGKNGDWGPHATPPAWAHAPRQIGSTLNSLRGAWLSDPMRDAYCHIKSYAVSDL
ncbi:MAG: hypothetical protein AAGF94_11305 [Pseudomonadota bacterium]